MKTLFYRSIFVLAIFVSSQVFLQSCTQSISEKPNTIISAMSFNIRYNNPNDKENWWENRKNEVVDLINYYHPDFLGIQEGLNDQVKFLDNNLTQYNYIGIGREDAKEKGEYSAIYYNTSKFKLIKHKTFWLSETPDKISVGWDAAMERICTYGSFLDLKTNKAIHVFNAHFDHMGNLARLNSAKLIVQKIKEFNLEKESVIVMGDLNTYPDSEPITEMKKVLTFGKDAVGDKFYGPSGTFNAFSNCKEITELIDFIFIKNLEVVNYRHIDDKRKNNLNVSDHFPVLIEVKN
jgi:endonuclease/exonuclease/phosphatase family metal-dependent hydrolase